MRRPTRDVFELGEEQLLDEPAVELAGAEDPSPPPPGDGPADEERGSVRAAERPVSAKPGDSRPPILAVTKERAGIAAGAVAALAISFVLVLSRPEDQALTERKELDGPAEERRRASIADARLERADRQSAGPRGSGVRSDLDDEPAQRAESRVANSTSVESQDEPINVAAAPATPAPAPAPTPEPAMPAPASSETGSRSLSRREVIAREFGP